MSLLNESRVDERQTGPGGGNEVLGTVIELLPSLECAVELENRKRVIAHPAAASKINFVRLRPGDQVAVVLSPRDPSRARIVKLLDSQARGRDRGII